MNIQDIHDLLADTDEPADLCHNWDGHTALFTLAEQGDEVTEGKWCYASTYLQEIATGNYYEITTSRQNCGYWGDGDNGDTEIRQVKLVKKVVEITEWVGA